MRYLGVGRAVAAVVAVTELAKARCAMQPPRNPNEYFMALIKLKQEA
jgi:hypothetical protein